MRGEGKPCTAPPPGPSLGTPASHLKRWGSSASFKICTVAVVHREPSTLRFGGPQGSTKVANNTLLFLPLVPVARQSRESLSSSPACRRSRSHRDVCECRRVGQSLS